MLKRFFVILFGLFLSINSAFAGDIDIKYTDGIYHIVLQGERIKRKKYSFIY